MITTPHVNYKIVIKPISRANDHKTSIYYTNVPNVFSIKLEMANVEAKMTHQALYLVLLVDEAL